MKDHIDLSIIVISFNTRDLLRQCLESIEAQRQSIAAEVIVVDNASTDGSAPMVRQKYPAATLIENDHNVGFAAANNQAICQAIGRHVLLLNSDTVLLPGALKQSLDYLKSHPDVGVLGCQVLNMDGTIQRTCFRFPELLHLLLVIFGLHRLPWPACFGAYELRSWKRDSERDVEVVTGCYMLIRRSAIEDVGLLDESYFFYGEETDWCLRFASAGWRVRFAPCGQIIHYGKASSLHLKEERGLLLAEAIVRLHRQHRSALSAACAFALIDVYYAARTIAFGIGALLSWRRSLFRRCTESGCIVLGTPPIWRRARMHRLGRPLTPQTPVSLRRAA